MGGTADEGVGRVGESVEHVLADESTLFGLHQWLQEVVDHLGVHGSLRGRKIWVQLKSKFELSSVV